MRFLQKSIRNKLTFYLLVSIIVPIVASIMTNYFYTKHSLENRFVEENTRLIFQGKKNLLNYMDTINRNTLLFYNNSYLMKTIIQGLSDYESETGIFGGLQSISNGCKEIYQVFLHISKNKYSYLFINGNLKRTISSDYANEFKPYLGKVYTEPTHNSQDYDMKQVPYYPPKPVFSVSRIMYNIPTTNIIGYISIDVTLDKLRELSSGLYKKGKEDLYIIDGSGAVVYSSNENIIGQTIQEPWIKFVFENPVKAGNFKYNSSGFAGIIIYDKIPTSYMNWILVKRIPFNSLYENARNLIIINMSVVGLFLIISIIITFIVTLSLTSPIKELKTHIKRIQSGHLDEKIKINSQDEIGILAHQFQEMMDTINNLILKEYKLDLENKTNQLKMLQAQINPHFMNNALQSIGKLALQYNVPKVYSLISSLGQMMHYNMNTREVVVPLSKELEYVEYYLNLQLQRFEDKFSYNFHIEKNTNEIFVPKMILQPVVENYFKHSFPHQKEAGILDLKTGFCNNLLQIIIEDNGTGMPVEQLQLLQYTLKTECKKDFYMSIGLKSVITRLQLYYGNKASIELSNHNPHGFRVVLTIPITISREILK